MEFATSNCPHETICSTDLTIKKRRTSGRNGEKREKVEGRGGEREMGIGVRGRGRSWKGEGRKEESFT